MNSEKALAGVKVVELSTFLAVPCCARLLADLGAEVIKIEPEGGDPIRWNGTSEGRPDDPYENTTWDFENANKRGIIVNTKTEEGKKILFQLLDQADVFLTNWRPQALQKNGLDYDTLKQRYPKLVYGSLTGYGEKGPDRNLPGFDFTAYFARGGFSGSLLQKGQSPMNLVPGLGDHPAAMVLSAGVLAALYKAQRTGKGEKVTTSLLHASIYAQAIMVMAAQYPDIGVEYPVDGREASNPFNCPYKTKDDRWIQLAMPPFDQYYPRFMPLIGRADLVGNPRYTMDNITKNHLNREFCDILYEAFATKTLEEWSEIFVANDIPFSKMQLWEEVIQDEQAWASDVFYSMHYDNGNTRTLVRMPVHLHEAGLSDYQRGPLLGEHSEQVLRELGYSDADLSRMHEAGIYKTWEDVKAKHNG